MKKISSIVLSSLLLLSPLLPHTAQAAVQWDGQELKKGQIGKLSVMKPTDLYKFDGTTKTVTRQLKPGEVYRIYSFLPGKLGLGGGYYIDRDDRIQYKTPSKAKLQELGITVTKQKYENKLEYPQVSNLLNKAAQDKINTTLKKHAANSYQAYLKLKAEEKQARDEYLKEHGKPIPEDELFMYTYDHDLSYEVRYNENNKLSILVYDYIYTGGAHGITDLNSYNFDILTGNQLLLGDVAKNAAGLSKIKKYAITDMKNRFNKGEGFFPESFAEIKVDNSRPFFFTPTGIVIKFYQYEVAPYAAGMPEVKIPYKVFQ